MSLVLSRSDRDALWAELAECSAGRYNRPAEAVATLARCGRKGCKVRARIYTLVRTTCRIDFDWGRVVAETKPVGYDDGYGHPVVGLACGHPGLLVDTVRGTFADKACGARCLNATGPACSCSCSGLNHGGGHPL